MYKDNITNSTCINIPGGYECGCLEGYRKMEGICIEGGCDGKRGRRKGTNIDSKFVTRHDYDVGKLRQTLLNIDNSWPDVHIHTSTCISITTTKCHLCRYCVNIIARL